ncbi:GNAT family N-acetyltransferase [Promicromonospora citrea]|uniref:N-acetyltransferase n=1 Tax=Promicromonospora citrea TaxID=43677 RepID=A0A8H9L2C9_9MICO|nr:GNAT family N-acetyltransferase [Promicromonospora citrea]NNH53065.1 GNAT family N-acetyltransferase [Promicromonospora citrea]GGM11006.1 N-acetyltransferase [Promicromonospora citrea]
MITVVPANEVSWEDLQTVLGERGAPEWCQCQWFKAPSAEFDALDGAERRRRFGEQTACGTPGAPSTSGLVAFLDGEPAGWCAVEPRTAYPRLRTSRLVWAGRAEDPEDASVWAVTCFVTRQGFRRRGIGTALARAAVEHARTRGATAVEGYPLLPRTDRAPGPGELFVGTVGMFEAAGFVEVGRPTPRRAVMRA